MLVGAVLLAGLAVTIVAPTAALGKRLKSKTETGNPPFVALKAVLREPRSFTLTVTASPRMRIGGDGPEAGMDCFRSRRRADAVRRRKAFDLDGETRYRKRVRPSLRRADACILYVALRGHEEGSLTVRVDGRRR